MPNRCGDCLLLNTPKCTYLYSFEEKTEIREVNSWKGFLQWVYTAENKPLIRTKLVRNTILPTDYACTDFIQEKR